jgi:hypothetical protein
MMPATGFGINWFVLSGNEMDPMKMRGGCTGSGPCRMVGFARSVERVQILVLLSQN